MSVLHSEAHEFAGKKVVVKDNVPLNAEFPPGVVGNVEDYWDRVYGKSWMDSDGNFAALNYAIRSGISGLPLDNDVLYVKIHGLGHLVHVSEVEAL